jgi:hypothetical protein
MIVYVYHATGDNEEIKVFSSLEKAIAYAKSTYYEDAEFEQDEDDENRWFYDDLEDPVEIVKLEIE